MTAALPAPGDETWAQQLLDWLDVGHNMAAFPEIGDYPWAQPLLDALLVEHNPDGTHIDTGGEGGTSVTNVVDSDAVQVTAAGEDLLVFVPGNPATARHSEIPSLSFHQTFHYEQATDPGAVGAHLWWADSTSNTLKRRNAANDDWEQFL